MDKCSKCFAYRIATVTAGKAWARGAWCAVWMHHAVDAHLVVNDA